VRTTSNGGTGTAVLHPAPSLKFPCCEVVRSEKIRQKAARITRKVKGVKKVVNELEIELPGAARSG